MKITSLTSSMSLSKMDPSHSKNNNNKGTLMSKPTLENLKSAHQ